MGRGVTNRLVASSESLSMKNPAPMATHSEGASRNTVARPIAWAAISAITST